MTDFNLSDRIRIFKEGEEIWTDGSNSIVLTHDVKEFIRLLKEFMQGNSDVEPVIIGMNGIRRYPIREIEELAGDKLK